MFHPDILTQVFSVTGLISNSILHWCVCYFILFHSSSSTTYVMEEDEPSFLEAIDYSAESNDEDAEPENEHAIEVQENPDHLDPLSDSNETNHRD